MLNKNGTYELYNATNNQKYNKEYTNLSTTYLSDYYASQNNTWQSGYIFVSDSVPYCVDFSTMKESRMNVLVQINAPLDYGYKYENSKR